MIQTLPLDMLLSLGLGMAFSLAQGDREKNKGVLRSTYFLVGLAVHFVLAFGVALICYILFPDWMFMYFTDHSIVPVAIVVYIFVGYFAMYILGFLIVRVMRQVRKELAWGTFFAVLAFTFVFIGLTFHRLWYADDFMTYMMGNPQAITSTALLPILAIAIPLAIAGVVVTVLGLKSRFAKVEAAATGLDAVAP